MGNRFVRATLVAAAAAGAYLAGARLRDAMPVRPGALAVLAVLGSAAVMSSNTCAKAASVDARLSDFLANGGTINGRVDITGGNLHLHGNNLNLEGGAVVP